MASSILCSPVLFPLSLLLFVLFPISLTAATAPLVYHNGPILSGNLDLGLVWYGRVGRVQKNTIRNFIKSLNNDNIGGDRQPQVSTWWHMVESYQATTMKENQKIGVQVVKQISDNSYSSGKILTKDFVKPLIAKATGGNKNVLAVIFAARDVTVDGLCMGICGLHGVIDLQPYIIVGNPETECPDACAWPFVKSKDAPEGSTLNPPSGNVAADAMVIAFAQALAETVTNPLNTGIYQGPEYKSIGVAQACKGIFGTGAAPGNTGKFLVDPQTGGGFNAHGQKGKKYLLPALWDPKTNTCWTLL